MHVLSFSPSPITLFKEIKKKKKIQIRKTNEWNNEYPTNPGNLMIKCSIQTRRKNESRPQGSMNEDTQ